LYNRLYYTIFDIIKGAVTILGLSKIVGGMEIGGEVGGGQVGGIK